MAEAASPAVIVKCAVCLGLLALIAAIGTFADMSGPGDATRAASMAGVAKSQTALDRKRVFDERRARFEAKAAEAQANASAHVPR